MIFSTLLKSFFGSISGSKASIPAIKYLSVVGAIFIFIPVILWSLLSFDLITPTSLEAFSKLIDYITYISFALLGVSVPKNLINSKISLKKHITDVTNIADEKERLSRTIPSDASITKSSRVLTLVRDVTDYGCFSRVFWEGNELPFFSIYELPLSYQGIHNVRSKTCINFGSYSRVKSLTSSCSGKFSDTGCYYVPNTEGRSGILIHYAGKRRPVDTYTRGCLIPYYNLKGTKTKDSKKAMADLVAIIGTTDFTLKII